MYTDGGLQQWHYLTVPKTKKGESILSEDVEDSPGKYSMMVFSDRSRQLM